MEGLRYYDYDQYIDRIYYYDYGYAEPCYYYWRRDEEGNMTIENHSANPIMKMYRDYDPENDRWISRTKGNYNPNYKLNELYNSDHYYTGCALDGAGNEIHGDWLYDWEYEYDFLYYWDNIKEKKYSNNQQFYMASWLYYDYFYVGNYTGYYWEYVYDADGNSPTVSGDGAVLTGGEKNDNISNEGNSVVINAGAGNDSITNSGTKVTIDGGAGNDSITNSSTKVTIDGGADNDYIWNWGANVLIDGGEGNDHIWNDQDNLYFWEEDVQLSSYVKLDGGAGDDYISNTLSTSWYHYNEETGYNFRDSVIARAIEYWDSYYGTEGWIYWTLRSDYSTLDGGSGNDTLINYGWNAKISGGEGDDSITNNGASSTVDGGDGTDTIENSGANVMLDGGAGDDSIISYGSKVTLDSGAGDDYIYSSGNKVSINAGAGNDSIQGDFRNNTINGGTGNDTIYDADYWMWYDDVCNLILYKEGDGNDVIKLGHDFYYEDYLKLQIGDGDGTYALKISDEATVIKVGNGSIALSSYSDSYSVVDWLYYNNPILGVLKYVELTENKDSYSNMFEDITILALSGDDEIFNSGNSVTIDAGEDIGDDYVENQGSNVSISTGNGNNTIKNYGQSSTIESGDDNDEIYNFGRSVIINAGDGDDHISNNENLVTINTGAGEDSIYNVGWHVSINAKDDDKKDYFYNECYDVTIEAGSGNDTIEIKGNLVTLDAGDGNDSINLTGNGEEFSIVAGKGDDSIFGKNDDEETSRSNSTIDLGDGKNIISLESSWNSLTVSGGDDINGVDAILSEGNYNFIEGKAGNDYILNKGDWAIIFGGADGDIIENYGNNVYIHGDDTKNSRKIGDYIYTDEGNDVTIDGGDNDDTITAFHDVRSSILGGSGNDYISLQRITASDVNKITGAIKGAVFNLASKVFSARLKGVPISSDLKLSNDLLSWLLQIGVWTNGKTPIGISFQVFSIAKTIYEDLQSFTKFAAYLGDLSSTSTVNGGIGNDVIVSDGFAPRVFEYGNGDGNDTIYRFTIDNFFKDALNMLTKDNFMSTLHITKGIIQTVGVDNTDITFKIGNGSVKLVDSTGKKFKVREADGTLTTRTYDTNEGNGVLLDKSGEMYFGMGGDDKIYGTKGKDTIYGGDDNDTICGGEIYSTGYIDNEANYMDGGAGNDSIISWANKNTIIGGTGDDEINVWSKDNLIIYNKGDGDDTINGLGGTLRIIGANYSTMRGSYEKGSSKYNDMIVEIGESYNQSGQEAIQPRNNRIYISNNANGSRFKVEGIVIVNFFPGGMVINEDKIVFDDEFEGNFYDVNDISSGEVKRIDVSERTDGMEIAGNNSIDYFKGSNSADVYHCEPLTESELTSLFPQAKDTSTNASESNNNAQNVLDTNISTATIEAGGGNDTIYGGARPNLYIYTAGDGNDLIYGFNTTSTLKIGGGTYSTTKSGSNIIVSVGTGKITLNGAASLSAVNISGTKTEENSWKLKGTTATFGTSTNTIITINGVKSTSGIIVDESNKTVTLKSGNLGTSNVTFSWNAGGYTFALDGVSSSTSTNAHFSGNTYKSASNTAGYALSSDKKSIAYTAAIPESDLFSVSGVKTTNGIVVDKSNKTVTLKSGNLDGKEVTVTGNYKLNLVKDVPSTPVKTVGSFTKFANGTATYKTTAYSDYYSLKNNKITYTAATSGKTIKIAGLNTKAKLATIKSSINVVEQTDGSLQLTFNNANVLAAKAPTISADSGITYTLAVVDNLKPTELAPDWKVSGSNASLKADTSVGYSVVDNQIVYSKKKTGSAQLVLNGLTKNASLTSPADKIITLNTAVLGTSASLQSNAGNYSVKLTGNMSGKTFTGTSKADTLNIAATNAAINGGAGNDSFTVSGSKITVMGGKGNDYITLKKSAMIIYSSGEGKDTVTYAKGMQISLSGSTEIKSLGKSGSDLVLGFGKNSSINITGTTTADSLKVTSSTSSVTLLADKFDLAKNLTFNSKNSSVKVAKNFTGSLTSSDDIYLGDTKLSSVSTINASNVTGKVTISGNAKANTIFAGNNSDKLLGGRGNDSLIGNAGNDKLYGEAGNDSLRGGTGNDSLWGGDGKDIFIYEAGKDVIANFTAGQDKIKIAKGKISKSSLSGSDVIFTIGSGSLKVKNAKGKAIALIDSSGKVSSTVVGAQSLTNNSSANMSIASDMGIVDASKRSKAITIIGNALANTISGGSKNDSLYGAASNDSLVGNAGNDKLYGETGNDQLFGGKGNDSLWGGKGNDSLWGDAGADTFFYAKGDGKDVIFGFDSKDTLTLDGLDFSTSYSKKNNAITFKVDGGSVILKEFGTTTTFHVNNDIYKISGTKLIKK